MNWKDRRIFSGQERGILSGMTPVEMTHGGMTPYPQGYQTGGMVGTELFEEGDEDVNDALNTMATMTNPEVPDMPGIPDIPVGPGPSTDVETEPTTDMEYETTVMQLKEKFQSDIRSYVAQAGTTDLEKYLQSMNVSYSNQLSKIKRQYNVTEFFPEEELLTENFVMELMEPPAIPGMADGGVALKEFNSQDELNAFFGQRLAPSIEDWKNFNPTQKNIFIVKLISHPELATEASGSTDAPVDRSVLDALIQQRREAAAETGEAARRNYASTSSSLLHNYDAGSAGRAAQAEAVDKAITGDIATELGLLSAQARGSKTNPLKGKGFEFHAKESEALTLGNLVDKRANKKFLNDEWSNQTKKSSSINTQERWAKQVGLFTARYNQAPPALAQFQGFADVIENGLSLSTAQIAGYMKQEAGYNEKQAENIADSYIQNGGLSYPEWIDFSKKSSKNWKGDTSQWTDLVKDWIQFSSS